MSLSPHLDRLVPATKAVQTLRSTIAMRVRKGWPWSIRARKRAMAQVRGQFLSVKRPRAISNKAIINGVIAIVLAAETKMAPPHA